VRARRTVFVRNLHTTVTTADVARHVAAACGLQPVDVFLQRKADGTIAGFGFVEMRTEEQAARLVAAGLPPFAGRALVVSRRRPREHRDEPRAPKQTERLAAHAVLTVSWPMTRPSLFTAQATPAAAWPVGINRDPVGRDLLDERSAWRCGAVDRGIVHVVD
jgi:hypothetical protein